MRSASTLHWSLTIVVGIIVPILTIAAILASAQPVFAQEEPAPVVLPTQETPAFTTDLSAEMIWREAQLVAAVNEKRRAAGVAPVRWNRELSEAARWFARDVVETPAPCGNVDSLKRGPGARLRAFGFTQLTKYGEMVVCGFTEPPAAVAAWMATESQRSVLFDPALREVGAGYYYNIDKGRGYIVLDLSVDPDYGPAVINGEALSTASTVVTLSVYNQTSPGVAMKVSNVPTFEGANWEPFVTERPWTLENGRGWRWVYVLIRDDVGRTSLLSDVIYLGGSPPITEISLDQATNIGQGFSLNGLKPPQNARVRLSLGWLVDSQDPGFAVLQGPAMAVDEDDALGGNALRMLAGEMDGLAYATIYDLPTDRVLTAYVRLKSPLVGGSQEIGQLRILAGDEIINARTLSTGDFDAADAYQEFALDFAFGATPALNLLQVEIARTGEVDLTVDAVRFFGRALAVEKAGLWSSGSSYYRSRGVVGRWEGDDGVGEPFDVAFATVDAAAMPVGAPAIAPDQATIQFVSENGVLSESSRTIFVCEPGCAGVRWEATTESSWLRVYKANDGFVLAPKVEGLTRGPYIGLVKLTPTSVPGGVKLSPASVYVELLVNYPDPTPDPEDPPVDPPPGGTAGPFQYAYLPAARR